METGSVAVEEVGSRSTVTRCFSKYPLRFIIPRKVGSSMTDAVWIYCLTYGGDVVSISWNFYDMELLAPVWRMGKLRKGN